MDPGYFFVAHSVYVIQVWWQLASRIRTEFALILLASCQQTYTTYTIAVCTVKNSWWWTEELSETCRVLFQKFIWEISASSWFCYKNPFWEANRSSSASHDIPHVYGSAHNLSPSWARSIHSMPLSHILKIHFNIILSSKCRLSKRCLSFRSFTKTLYATLVSPTCHMRHQSYSSWFYHPNSVWYRL